MAGAGRAAAELCGANSRDGRDEQPPGGKQADAARAVLDVIEPLKW
jgi:hypothetical protein